MKRNCAFFVSLMFFCSCSPTPPTSGGGIPVNNTVWNWTVEDGAALDVAVAVGNAVDSSGNVYVTGSTSKAIDGQVLHGTNDFFISKYSTSGILQWTVEDGVVGQNTGGKAIAADASGNVYVTGFTGGALDGQTLHGTDDLSVSYTHLTLPTIYSV